LKEFDFSNLMNLNLSDFFPDAEKFEEKKSEVALLIMGQFAEDIVAYQETSNKSFDFLIIYKSLLNVVIKSNNPIVVGRALWCLSRLNTCTSTSDFETVSDMLQIFSGFLSPEFHLPLRLIASKSLNNLIQRAQKDDEDLTTFFKVFPFN
jgi:hypothetical protein